MSAAVRTVLRVPSHPTTHGASILSPSSVRTRTRSSPNSRPDTVTPRRTSAPFPRACSSRIRSVRSWGIATVNGWGESSPRKSSRLSSTAKCPFGIRVPSASKGSSTPRESNSSSVRAWTVSALEFPSRSVRRSRTVTSAPPYLSSAASHRPTGPAPTITTL